mgnify:CR=1 FL=1
MVAADPSPAPGDDPSPIVIRIGWQGGFGMTGMAERARSLGGRLNVHSHAGQGTTVSLRVRIEDRAR